MTRPESSLSPVLDILAASCLAQPLHAAARLGVADVLADGPLPLPDLADRCGAHAPTLGRILRALAGAGIFAEAGPDLFVLTPAAEGLRRGALRSTLLLLLADWHERARIELPRAAATGASPFALAHGCDAFAWLHAHPEAAALYDEANADKAARDHVPLLAAYPFAGDETVVDVGGGTGALLLAMLSGHPGLRGVVAERPAVAEVTRAAVAERQMSGRCRVEPADFFERVPDGDILLLANILHDWDDADCLRILAACRRALAPGGRLLVLEMLLPDAPGLSAARLMDLEMLIMGSGRERALAEFEALLERGGFAIRDVLRGGGEAAVLVCAAIAP